jgi:aminoglycoside phosphotransferase (APT) family kinase protein
MPDRPVPDEALAHVPGCTSGERPLEIVRLPGGSVNRSYAVRSRAGRFVLRLSPGTDAWLAADRSVERRLHGIAAAAGLAPRIIQADAGDRWLITEFVPGPVWTEAEFARPESLGRLGDALRRLHSLDAPSCGRFDLLGALHGYARRINAVEEAAGGELAGYLEKAAEAWQSSGAAARPLAVLHHDLHGSNVIEGEQGLVLIDWECGAVSDPLLDVACVLSYYEGSRAHSEVLLEHAGLRSVTGCQLAAAVWLFDLHTLFWYRERRLRLLPTAAELAAERHLAVRVALGWRQGP